MTTYGHLNFLCSFKELFELRDNGIILEGKEYKWNEIKKIERSRGSFFLTLFMSRYPRATMCLNDGTKIRMNGRVFTAKDEKPKFGAEGFLTSESKAFNQVIEIIQKRIETKTTEQGNQGDWR